MVWSRGFQKSSIAALITAAMVILHAPATAKVVYKVVQADGTVLYTDQPVPGSEPFDLSTVNTSSMPRLATPNPTSVKPGDPESPNYKVQVVSPAPEATFRDNDGRVAITATVSPQISAGSYQLWMDNERVTSQNFGSFILDNVNPGAHTFYVSVLDNTGKTLASSEPQTFYMHRASVLRLRNLGLTN